MLTTTSTEKTEFQIRRQRLKAEAGDDAQADVHVATNIECLVEENDEFNIGELPFENEFELDDCLNLEQTITDVGADDKPQIEDDYEHNGHEDEQHQVQGGEEYHVFISRMPLNKKSWKWMKVTSIRKQALTPPRLW